MNHDLDIALTGDDAEHVCRQLGLDDSKVSYPIYLIGDEYRITLRVQAFSLDTERDPSDRNLKEVSTRKTSRRVRAKSSF